MKGQIICVSLDENDMTFGAAIDSTGESTL
jgi:hypothetical protein